MDPSPRERVTSCELARRAGAPVPGVFVGHPIGSHPSPRHVMLVLAIGFAGVSVKEGILAVCSTEGESAGESSSCTRARDLVMDAG